MGLLKLLRFNQQRIQQELRERVESVPESLEPNVNSNYLFIWA